MTATRRVFAAWLVLWAVGTAGGACYAQYAAKTSIQPVTEARIPHFRLSGQTLEEGVLELAHGPAPFAFGFENILRDKVKDRTLPQRRLTLQLNGMTVAQILNSLCRADSRYTWSRDGSTINVYPRATVRDPSYLMNRRLKVFRVAGITHIDQGLLAIARELPPPIEQIAHVEIGGSVEYPAQPWTATFRNVTVRQVLNRLADHIGPRSSWVLYGSRQFREFGFYQGPAPKGPPSWVTRMGLVPGAPVVSHLALEVNALRAPLAGGEASFTAVATLDKAAPHALPVTFKVTRLPPSNPAGVALVSRGRDADVKSCRVTHAGGSCSVSFPVASSSSNAKSGSVVWQFLYDCNCRDATYRTLPNPLTGMVTFER